VKEAPVNFYVLEHPPAGHDDALTDFLFGPGKESDDAPRCSKCGGFIGSMNALPPIRVELETWGGRFGDLAFGVGNDFLACGRFKDEFLRSGLTGLFGFTPAEITKVVVRGANIPNQTPNYFYVVPGRSRAAIDQRKSEIEYERPWTCAECRVGYMRRFQRIALEPNTWSGEDVFIARGLPGFVITSERFKEFCDRHAFSNCLLIEAERSRHDFMPWRRGPAPRSTSQRNRES
jgi:hypothetical protein